MGHGRRRICVLLGHFRAMVEPPRRLAVERRQVSPGADATALVIWTAINPSSWFARGPLYLIRMLLFRQQEYADQVATLAGPNGVYFLTRYLVPLEFGSEVHKRRPGGEPATRPIGARRTPSRHPLSARRGGRG